jgi:hypothetical protein
LRLGRQTAACATPTAKNTSLLGDSAHGSGGRARSARTASGSCAPLPRPTVSLSSLAAEDRARNAATGRLQRRRGSQWPGRG